MYLCYLDASGTPLRKDPENLVLASLIINETNWALVENQMNSIKQKYFPDVPPYDVEIHAKDMMNGKGVFGSMNAARTYQILDEIFLFLNSNRSIFTIESVLIYKNKIKQTNFDFELWAHRLLFERINRFMEEENSRLIQEGNPPQFGLMIEDTQGETKDRKLRSKVTNVLKSGTYYSKLSYLIEAPIFADSKWKNLSQLVDCVAYAIRSFHGYSNQSAKRQKWVHYYNQIEPLFGKCSDGTYLGCGLKIFPSK